MPYIFSGTRISGRLAMNLNALRLLFCCMLLSTVARAQIDTSFLFNTNAPFGKLDIRVAKSPTEYYYLEEGRTFSFRQKNGENTRSYFDMTAWDSSPYEQGNMRVTGASDHFVMNYRILKPTNYDRNFAKGYPLVIVLHGLQERGNCADNECYHATTNYSPNENNPPASSAVDNKLLNNDYNLVHGGSNYLEARNETGTLSPDNPDLSARAFPGFVLFPQNLNGWDAASAEDAIRLVRLIIKKYNIDGNRIYINGVSNGGHGAYEVMKRAPWLFSAGILFSAADDASITSENFESLISGIPLWIFQGGVDKKPTTKQTEGYVKKLREAGANVRYTLYPQLGHGTWNKAFAEPDFFSWMLRQRNNNIHVFGDNPAICSTTGRGAQLSLPEGYLEYQWEFNGQIVTDEVSFKLAAQTPGNYRARTRKSGNEWNDWSEVITVSENIPERPVMEQSGTVLLKDPNLRNEAVLIAKNNSPHYYWYKDGVLLNLPGSQDDTFKIANIKSGFGDGAYTLRTAGFDNCISPPSIEKHLFFSDRAPVTLPTPSEFAFSNVGPSSASVTWQDVSDNESGFEIWRKNSSESLWVLASIANQNATTFNDIGLSPSADYQYIIRAVGNTGRSQYSAAQSIHTPPDLEQPPAPTGLTAELQGVKKLRLTWNASQDNSSLKEYWIFNNNDTIRTSSSDTSYVLSDFSINMNYRFNVKAVDIAGNVSAASNDATIYTKVHGLFYEHSTGDWKSLEEIDWSIVEFTGVVEEFTLSPKTQEDFFNFRFDGFLNIVADGIYQLRISSNDGSRLALDDSLLIMNDGIHNLATVTAPIQLLSGGPHRITVDFFDSILSDSLSVEYKGPDTNNEWIEIPKEKLSSDVITSVEDLSQEDEFNFSCYPNPWSEGDLTLLFSSRRNMPVEIYVMSASGETIYSTQVNPTDNRIGILSEVINRFANGLYIVRASQGKSSLSKKLLIDK